MSGSDLKSRQGDAVYRRALRIKDGILYLAVPLLGFGFISILKTTGMELPEVTSGYSGAQLAGLVALGLLATVVFLVGPWVVLLWHFRRERARRAESISDAG